MALRIRQPRISPGIPSAPVVRQIGLGAASATIASASFNGVANTRLIVWADIYRNSNSTAGAPNVTSTVSTGTNPTWTALGNGAHSSNNTAPDLYTIPYISNDLGPTPPTGIVVTVGTAGLVTGAAITVLQVKSDDINGTLVQSAAGEDLSAGDPSFTFAAPVTPGSLVIGHNWQAGTTAINPPTGFTELDDQLSSTGRRVETFYSNFGASTGPNQSISTGTRAVVCAIELQAKNRTVQAAFSMSGSSKVSFRKTAGAGDPTLLMDFVQSIYIGKQPSDLTVARSGATTYVSDSQGILTAYGTNTPRYNDQGLLVESARTNEVRNSTFSGNWTQTNLTYDSLVLSPIGDTTATYMKENTSNAVHYNQSGPWTGKGANNLPVSFSCFVKSIGGRRVCLELSSNPARTNGAYAVFDLTNGQVAVDTTTFGSGWSLFVGPAKIERIANGYYRCSFAATSDAVDGITGCIILDNGTGTAARSITYTGDGTSGIHAWGAQIELMATSTAYYPSSYIHSPVASTATRAADDIRLTGANFTDWYTGGTTANTFAIETLRPAIANQGHQAFAAFNQSASAANEIDLAITSNGSVQVVGTVSSSTTLFVNGTGAVTAIGSLLRQAFAWATNYLDFHAQGAEEGTPDTSGAAPSVNQLAIGERAPGTNQLDGYIRSIYYWPELKSNADLNVITALPLSTMSMDFVNGVYSGAQLSDLSVGRTGTAYAPTAAGTLTAFAANTPRVTDLGLFTEYTKTNRTIQSGFAATWGTTNATLTPNAAVSPDGTANAATLIESTATNTHPTSVGFSKATSAIRYCVSVYAKAVGNRRFVLAIEGAGAAGGAYAVYDLVNGQIGVTTTTYGTGWSASDAPKIEALANGWYRCSLVVTSDTTNFATVVLKPDIGTGTQPLNQNYTGDGVSGLQLFGPQTEDIWAGLDYWPSSYIATGAAAVTRPADNIRLTGTGFTKWFSGGPLGTGFIEFTAPPSSGSNQFLLDFNGGVNDDIRNFYTSLRSSQQQVNAGGSLQAALIGSTVPAIGSTVRQAFAWAPNDFDFHMNGAQEATPDTSGDVPTLTALHIGQNLDGSFPFEGFIRAIGYWSVRKSDSELNTITQIPGSASFSMGGAGSVAFVSSTVATKTYYFSLAGSDSNDGLSTGAPKLTIAAANGLSLNPGDTVSFRGGDTFNTTTGLIAPADGITYNSYGTGKATINLTVAGADAGVLISKAGSTVNNLIVTGPGAAAASKSGIMAYKWWAGAPTIGSITISNCQVSGFDLGINISGGSAGAVTSATITGNECSGNRQGIAVWGGGVSYGCSNITITNNYVHDNTTIGIALGAGTQTYTISGNAAKTNGGASAAQGPSGIFVYESDSGTISGNECWDQKKSGSSVDGIGIDVEGSSNVVIEKNYVHANDAAGLQAWTVSGGPAQSNITFRYNIAIDNGIDHDGNLLIGKAGTPSITNLRVYGNTFVQRLASKVNWVFTDSTITGFISSNISHVSGSAAQSSGTVPGTPTKNKNLFFGGTGFGSNQVTSDPLFTDILTMPTMGYGAFNPATLNGYRVQSSSPAINAGEDINGVYGVSPGTTDFYGNTLGSPPINIGAYDGAGAPPVAGALASSGSSTVAFVGVAAGAGALSSSGSSTAAFTGRGAAAGVLASAGSSTAAFTGRGAAAGALSTSGSTTAAFISTATAASVFASNGAASVAFVGQASTGLSGVLNTSGSTTSAFVSAATVASALASSGSTIAAFSGQSLITGVLATSGSATASFVGVKQTAASFASAGSTTIAFLSSATVASVLASSGSTVSAFTGQGAAVATLVSAGTSTAAFTSLSAAASVLSATGSTTATFASAALVARAFASSGSTTAAFASAAAAASALSTSGAASVAFASSAAVQSNGVLNTSGTGTASFVSTVSAASGFSSSGSSTGAFVGRGAAATLLETGGWTDIAFTGRATTVASLATSGSTTNAFVGRGAAVASFASSGFTSIAWVGQTNTAGNGVLNTGGSSTVAFVSTAVARSALSSSGTGTASFVGAAAISTSFASSGSSLAAFTAQPIGNGVLATAGSTQVAFAAQAASANAFSMSGSTTASFAGAVTVTAVLISSGSTTAAFTSLAVGGAALASAGSSTIAFGSTAIARSALSASGSTTVAFASAAVSRSALSSSGAASVAFVGTFGVGASGILNTSGSSTATFQSTVSAASVLTSSGSAVAAFGGRSAAAAALASAGGATVAFTSAAAKAAALSSSGSSTASFASAAIIRAAFATAGSTTTAWTGATVRSIAANQSMRIGQVATAEHGIPISAQANQSLKMGQVARIIPASLDGPPIWIEGSIGPDDILTGSIDSDVIYGDTNDLELEGEV